MRRFVGWRKKKFYYGKFMQLGFCILVVSLVLINTDRLLAAEPYYKGKTLILLNNFPPGGSSDVWTRLLARHISRFIPGGPTVIVQNMPGANGMIGYQWLTKSAKPDGLAIGCLGGNLVSGESTGEFPAGTLSLREAEIIATVADTDVLFGRKAIFTRGYKSLLSPTRRPFVIADLKRDDTYVRDQAIMNLLGLKKGSDYIQVYGYPGGNDAYLAMGRGEADMYATRVAGYRQTPLREVNAGNWVPLMQGGFFAASRQLVRDPGVQDIPTIREVILELTGKEPSGPYHEFLQWLLLGKSVIRLVIVPPRTPKDAILLLTEAWRQMVKDPQFRSDQEKVFGTKEENMLLGEEARRRVQLVLGKPVVVDKVVEELINK